jgi:transcription-repair coupling factor (superfamily II helicase)
VPGEQQRLGLYRRLAAVASEEELAALQEELRDRYGEPPAPVQNLFRLVELKLLALAAGVADISTQDGRVVVRLLEEARLGAREQKVLQGLFTPSSQLARRGARSALPRATFGPLLISFGYDRKHKEQMLSALQTLLETLRRRAEARSQPLPERRQPVAV